MKAFREMPLALLIGIIGTLSAHASSSAVVDTLLASAPHSLYSYFGFSRPASPEEQKYGREKKSFNFSPETKAGDLVTAEGNMVLFRNISQPYVKGFKDNGESFIKREGNAYSYSLSPAIIKIWASPEDPNSYTLIAVQNIELDGLQTKVMPAGPISEETTVRTVPLTKDLLVREIAFYDEVKVPVARERVVAIVKQSDFKKVFEKFNSQGPFSPVDFLKAVSAEPSFKFVEAP